MGKRILSTSPSGRGIRETGPVSPRVEPHDVAIALGAEDVGAEVGAMGSPITFFRLCTELAARLRSSGGRPSLEGATRRVKIPVTDRQWREIEDLAASLSDQGFTPSAGQVASALLSLSLPQAKRECQLFRRELASHAGACQAETIS